MSTYLDKAFAPAELGKLTLRNRIIKAATFEGKTPGGVPGDALLGFHKPICEGGIGMTTIAYCAAEADGRVNGNMTYMDERFRPQLSHIVSELQQTGARVSGQLSHCGHFSKNRDLQRLKRPLGPSPHFNILGAPSFMPYAGAMTHGDIDATVEIFGAAAAFMKSVGFDAIEIHFGHGYGLSQFISPKTNRRTDDYGGSLFNRMRFPLRVLEAVRATVGDDFPLLGKMGLTDGVRGGTTEDDAREIAQLLDKGGIDALITSGGTSSYNVMKMFRGPSIVDGMIEQETNPIMKLGLKLLGPRMFRDYPYEELYFLDLAKRVRDLVQCQMVYIGGCSDMDSLDRVMREGFDFVQMGRPLIKDPAYVNNAMASRDTAYDYQHGCIHCNRCVALIDSPDGVRCPLNDEGVSI